MKIKYYSQKIFLLLATSSLIISPYSKTKEINLLKENLNLSNREKLNFPKQKHFNKNKIAEIIWNEFDDSNNSKKDIKWEEFEKKNIKQFEPRRSNHNIKKFSKNIYSLNSMNRSIVFNNKIIGPDISWIVPPGLAWNKKYKFDLNIRGHNTKIPEPKKRKFFAWNDGDAVGLISYQFLHTNKSSFGINLGIRSLYKGQKYTGGGSDFGDGLSSGFRYDYELSDKSGFAFGAEQLLHFDGSTDTGRNIYLTASRGFWRKEYKDEKIFPLFIATTGLATGRMAVGTIRGFCGDYLGGSGTEIGNKRNLCWSPIFSLASVWNKKFSTFFEYNSRFFLIGSSLVPLQSFPVRGTFALILSDHVDNYKLHSPSEINWVFNISLGF